MIKVAVVISNINKALGFEHFAEVIDKDKVQLFFVLINAVETDFERFLLAHHFAVIRIPCRGKKSMPLAIFKTAQYFRKNNIEIVHAHLFEGSLIGLCAAKLVGIKHRIHTRHHSSFHHDSFPRAVYGDKLNNALSTKIIAISENVKNVLVQLDGVNPTKIEIVHHGFKLNDFKNVPAERIEILKNKYNAPKKSPVIGVISRYLKLKGIDFIIEAFEQVLKKHPNALLIIANAKGSYKVEIQRQLNQLPSDSYIEIAFENDLYALYQLFDIFVHVPINKSCEAFGQIYIEALAAGIPSVFTLSGIAPEFVVDKKNALVVDYQSATEIEHAITLLLKDQQLRNDIIANGHVAVHEKFDYVLTNKKIETIYLKCA